MTFKRGQAPFLKKCFYQKGPGPFWVVVLGVFVAAVSGPAWAFQGAGNIDFQQALKLKQEGRQSEAENYFRRAIEEEPGNASYHFELGNLFIEKEDLLSARFELEQAVMIDPDMLAARYNLGLVYRELDMTSDARAEFQKILERDPFNQKAKMQIGYTYQQDGFYEDARYVFQEARSMDVTNPEPQQALADLEVAEERESENSQRDLQRRMLQSRQQLYGQGQNLFGMGSQQDPNSGSGNQTALLQAGAALLQQMMANRGSSDRGQN